MEQALTDKPHRIGVAWGIDRGDIREYSFATEQELDAFIKGCEEAVGWMDALYLDYLDEGRLQTVEEALGECGENEDEDGDD